MPDVAELLDELAGLPDRPPASPRPVGEIHRRVHRRRQRRRARRAALVVTVLLVAGVVGVLGTRGPGGDQGDVDLAPAAPPAEPSAAPPTTIEPDGTVRVLEARGMTVDPAGGLEAGQEVTVALTPDTGGRVELTQCLAEVLEQTGSPDPSADQYCDGSYGTGHRTANSDMSYTVNRWMGNGTLLPRTVDCAAAPGRCVLVARLVTSARSGETEAAGALRYAPLVFRDDLPVPSDRTAGLVGIEGPIEDGQIVRLEGSGFGHDAQVTIVQCLGTVEEQEPGRDLRGRCDGIRIAGTRTDGAGSLTADVRIFHDIGLSEPPAVMPETEWTPCSPCSLVLTSRGPGRVVVPIELAPTDDPIRPAMTVTPEGPHEAGDVLRVEGSGYQVRMPVSVDLCATATPPGRGPLCGGPEQRYTTTDAQGAFVIDRYPLSAAGVAFCAQGTDACLLIWQVDGWFVGADVPLDVTG